MLTTVSTLSVSPSVILLFSPNLCLSMFLFVLQYDLHHDYMYLFLSDVMSALGLPGPISV